MPISMPAFKHRGTGNDNRGNFLDHHRVVAGHQPCCAKPGSRTETSQRVASSLSEYGGSYERGTTADH
jgi:hypothetical protein